MSNRVLYGLLGGFIATALLSVLYVMDKNYMLQGYEKFSWLVLVAAMFVGVIRERDQQKGKFINFYDALRTAFQIFVIGYLIKFVFIFVLFNYIDPELLELAKEKAVEIFIEHRNTEDTELVFEQKLKAYKEGYFGPRIFDLGIMLEIIMGFVLAALTAFLFKREAPDY